MTSTIPTLSPAPRTDAPPRAALPAQDLVLLGILMDGEKHGYELRQLIERRLGQIAIISVGTIYYTLRKLERRGLVRMRRDREGKRPQRHVYSITAAGEQEFREMLRQSFLEQDLPYCTFDVGLYFVPYAELHDALAGAHQQVARLTAFENHVATLEHTYPGQWPFNLEAIKRHVLAIARAHRAFYQEIEQDFSARAERARTRTTSGRTQPSKRRTHDG